MRDFFRFFQNKKEIYLWFQSRKKLQSFKESFFYFFDTCQIEFNFIKFWPAVSFIMYCWTFWTEFFYKYTKNRFILLNFILTNWVRRNEVLEILIKIVDHCWINRQSLHLNHFTKNASIQINSTYAISILP